MRQQIIQLQAAQDSPSPRRLSERRNVTEQEDLVKKATEEIQRLEQVLTIITGMQHNSMINLLVKIGVSRIPGANEQKSNRS